MKYKILLFDLDGTLLDFDKSEEASLQATFKKFAITYSNDAYTLYQKINKQLWIEYEKQAISKQYIIDNRFKLLLEELGCTCDKEAFAKYYQTLLAESAVFVDGAKEVLDRLKNDFELHIVTNGVATTQRNRLKISKIETFVKSIFVSDEMQCQKPQKAFFDICFKKINLIDKKEAIIIGDSLSSDILGGINAGIDSCYVNLKRVVNMSEIKPTYEINSLEELYTILK